MNASHAHSATLASFDYFTVGATCGHCRHADDDHTVRTWWSAPNRTAGWDAPTTSGASYAIGAQPARLTKLRTRFLGQSRCSECGTARDWWIVASAGRITAIEPADDAARHPRLVRERPTTYVATTAM